MTEPIVTREQIARQAEAAARMAALGEEVLNPYPPHSAAALAWNASFVRSMQAVATPDSEASA